MSEATDKATILGEPAWEIAHLFPNQGHWSEAEYLSLHTNHLVEFADGSIEVLPMPTMMHQVIVLFLYEAIRAYLKTNSRGVVLVAPLRVKLWEGRIREPDLVFMLSEHADRMGNAFWTGADLVIEIVSPEIRNHDPETKRKEYARAGIPEYWIVDPQRSRISVLRLDGGTFAVHGEFSPGEVATSALLPGFAVGVAEVLEARP